MSTGPRIAVTGFDGFVGWHVRCAARARWGGDVIGIGIPEFADPDRLDAALTDAGAQVGADVTLHVAARYRASYLYTMA